MVRAQERGMGEMREWTARPKDKNTDRHASRYSGACPGGGGWGGSRPSGLDPLLTSAGAEQTPAKPCEPRGGREEEEKGGARRRDDVGGGDMDGDTTLVIGSLATVG